MTLEEGDETGETVEGGDSGPGGGDGGDGVGEFSSEDAGGETEENAAEAGM